MVDIYTHSDADGITSAVLYTLFLSSKNEKPDNIFYPKIFGEVTDSKECDVMLDMVPTNPSFSGQVFDHHEGHPKKEERKYALIRRQFPTSMIIYRSLKIPLEHIWKTAIGVAGDGQPELIDLTIFQHFPLLLESKERTTKFGTHYYVPIVQELSTLINSACRANLAELSFCKLMEAKKIENILYDPELTKLKEIISYQTYITLKNYRERILSYNIIYLPFKSDYSLAGRIATMISMKKNTTAIALNTRNGKLSIRGMLSDYVAHKLKEINNIVEIGGHAGFKGGKVDTSKLSQFENFLQNHLKDEKEHLKNGAK